MVDMADMADMAATEEDMEDIPVMVDGGKSKNVDFQTYSATATIHLNHELIANKRLPFK